MSGRPDIEPPRRIRKTLYAALLGLCALIVIGGVFAVLLIYPGTPGNAKSLTFKGYVLLPRGALLTVLDYMNVTDTRLFVTDVSSGSVYKIELRNQSLPGDQDVSAFALEPAAHGVVVDPLTGVAYVSRSKANTVDVFDPASMKLIVRIPVADDPDGIFYDPFHKLVYVASGDAKVGTVIDPGTRSTIATIPLGGKPEFAVFDPQTSLMYQNLQDTNSVVAIDLDKKAVVQHWTLDQCRGPSGIAIDDTSRRLFIVCSGNNVLVVFDINKQREIQTFPIGGGPDSVVFDGDLHRIYTTGRAGVLVVFQQDSPDGYHMIDSVKLHFGAHTLAVDSATHFVYVGYASLGVGPRVAVFQPLP
jgi:YVTN family beta-propeller protein